MIFKPAHKTIYIYFIYLGKQSISDYPKCAQNQRRFNSAGTPNFIVSAARRGLDSETFYKEAKWSDHFITTSIKMQLYQCHVVKVKSWDKTCWGQ